MRKLGVRELKEHLSEVLDEVRDGQVIEVTRNGRVIARIIPVGQEVGPEARRAVLQSMNALAKEKPPRATRHERSRDHKRREALKREDCSSYPWLASIPSD